MKTKVDFPLAGIIFQIYYNKLIKIFFDCRKNLGIIRTLKNKLVLERNFAVHDVSSMIEETSTRIFDLIKLIKDINEDLELKLSIENEYE